jgi:hypothetical protein
MKERYQNPVVSDEVRLRLFAYNSNNRANIDEIEKVEIYFLDPAERSDANPDGRRLLQTVEADDITTEETGLYSVTITAENELYLIGNYIDVWYCTVRTTSTTIENSFAIYPDLWFTTPTPIVYDFNFAFRPNRVRKGSKRYLMIEVTPNVPGHDQLAAYYQNLAIVSPIKIWIEQHCGECVPAEEDLRMIVDGESVELREKCLGYYFLDTTEMEVGMYDVWFEIELGENVYISEKSQLQIA